LTQEQQWKWKDEEVNDASGHPAAGQPENLNGSNPM